MSKLWQKSSTDTESEIAKKVEAFTVGNDYRLDQALVPFDLKASAVHARALHKAGVLSDDETKKLTETLSEIERVWKKGEFNISVQDEDMHTAIENYLTEKLGDLGKKIHTGRSRNDQVLTAIRLFENDALQRILPELNALSDQLVEFGKTHKHIPMPGFTHTRKAMLSSVALWAGGFAELLRMQHHASSGVEALIGRSPLGTAAGFGTSIDIDRDAEAAELCFSQPMICSTSAQLSRGWVELQFVQYLSGISAVLNRLASDIIQYTGETTPYFSLDDVVCTGSSIMPQKKNPDLAELIRGRHSLFMGYAATLQSATTNLTSGYHRDLQLTKEPVLKAVTDIEACIEAAQILISSLNVNEKEITEACTVELFAAEEAYKLVKEKNISFREAYRIVAENPENAEASDPGQKLTESTHLGSTGNPGLERV
ncbi:argininosuccinate lyase [Rhodohalobacter sp. SW132]|uniref:argininosuccinate lyase n=1 Tax=Rhodohalobacter sp. SW132 TaxID=2293433 RepID=UPI000E287F02|nr:argininosuccinate lyase [Rhodohalobacter sp. SW132]REL38941.1 argininosuccinate lyase [Rhodohalobacter sp. SW132]